MFEQFFEIINNLTSIKSFGEFISWYGTLPILYKIVFPLGLFGLLMAIYAFIKGTINFN